MRGQDPFGLVGVVLEGRYTVEGVVGEGGFGVVYSAQNPFGERVAIKCLKLTGDRTSDAAHRQIEAFRREGQLLRRLSKLHTSIVEVLDLGRFSHPQLGDVPYLVLEWLDGRPLDAEIRARELPYSEREAAALLAPALSALAIAHQGIDGQAVAHRDLKPENLFVPRTPGSPLKVLDFGIAKVMQAGDESGHESTGTAQQFRAFSPMYGAPEQFLPRRFGGTGPWTDVHALGLILTQLVLGRPPHQETDYGELLLAATDPARRPTPRQLGARVSDAFEAVCARALLLDPRERYPNAGALAEALAAAAPALSAEAPTAPAPALSAEAPTAPAAPPPAVRTQLPTPTWQPDASSSADPQQSSGPSAAPGSATALRGSVATMPALSPDAAQAAIQPAPRRAPVAALAAGASALLGLGALVLHAASGGPAPQPIASSPTSAPLPSASAAASASTAPVFFDAPTASTPRWVVLVLEAQARVVEGDLKGAAERLQKALAEGNPPVARVLLDHVNAAAASDGPCHLAAIARLRPLRLASGSVGRPSLVRTPSGLLALWTDDHESANEEHIQTQHADLRTLRPLDHLLDVTPESARVALLSAASQGSRTSLAYVAEGSTPGLWARPLAPDGRIFAPATQVRSTRAAIARPSMARSESQLWVAWKERSEQGIFNLFVSQIPTGDAAHPIRLTNMTERTELGAPQIVLTPSSLEAIFTVKRASSTSIGHFHIPLDHEALTRGYADDLPPQRQDQTQVPLHELSIAGKTAAPSLACAGSTCFVAWHGDAAGDSGAHLAPIDPSTGKAIWQKTLSSGSARPSLASADDGSTQMVWYESGRLMTASVRTDSVGPSSTLGSVTGEPPPASLISLGPGEWAAAWLSFEGGRLEPYAARYRCQAR